MCRYDDGTGDELEVPLGTTAFVSGKTMFDILPEAYKNLAVRSKVKYSPHPYVWMAPAHAMPTGLGIESEGLELPTEELPEWEESKLKIFPMVCCRLIFTILSKREIYLFFLLMIRFGKILLRVVYILKYTLAVRRKFLSIHYPRVQNARELCTLMVQSSPT